MYECLKQTTELLIDPVKNGVIEAFQQFVGLPIRQMGRECSTDVSQQGMSALIEIVGPARGIIVVDCHREVIASAARSLLGDDSFDDVLLNDLVCELANMVGGAAKLKVYEQGYQLGLPSTICSTKILSVYPAESKSTCLTFTTEQGGVAVHLGVVTHEQVASRIA